MVNIAEDYGKCNLCKEGKMTKKDEKEVGGTRYLILKCDKCNHEIARSVG